jgi:hypothetical protein
MLQNGCATFGSVIIPISTLTNVTGLISIAKRESLNKKKRLRQKSQRINLRLQSEEKASAQI